jgi:hypothetical protein
MQPHPCPQRPGLGPRFGRHALLDLDRGRDRVRRRGEHRGDPITHPRQHRAVVRVYRVAQDLVVARQRLRHRLRQFLPQARRALEIGEHERHRPRGKRGHAADSDEMLAWTRRISSIA